MLQDGEHGVVEQSPEIVGNDEAGRDGYFFNIPVRVLQKMLRLGQALTIDLVNQRLIGTFMEMSV